MERKLGTVSATENSAVILLEENKYCVGIRGIRLRRGAFWDSQVFELVYTGTTRKYGDMTLQKHHLKLLCSTLQNNSFNCRVVRSR
jgi:hypothetical protein